MTVLSFCLTYLALNSKEESLSQPIEEMCAHLHQNTAEGALLNQFLKPKTFLPTLTGLTPGSSPGTQLSAIALLVLSTELYGDTRSCQSKRGPSQSLFDAHRLLSRFLPLLQAI